LEEIAGIVSFGNASKVEVKDKVKVKRIHKNGGIRMIEDTYFISEMKSNILSISQLIKKGYKIFLNRRSLNLEDKIDILVLSVEMTLNEIFKLDLNTIQERSLKLSRENKNELCHLRFGHIRYAGLKETVKK
jgi:hypothetical protein